MIFLLLIGIRCSDTSVGIFSHDKKVCAKGTTWHNILDGKGTTCHNILDGKPPVCFDHMHVTHAFYQVALKDPSHDLFRMGM
jgi:hypothetical protein